MKKFVFSFDDKTAEKLKNKKNIFPSAKKLSETGLSLPSGPNLSKLEIKIITNLIRVYLTNSIQEKFYHKKNKEI